MDVDLPPFDTEIEFPGLPEKRQRRPTAKIIAAREDVLPEGPGHLEDESNDAPESQGPVQRVLLHVSEHVRTAANAFGLSREYRRRPTAIPDTGKLPQDFVAASPTVERKRRRIADIIYPYPNLSAFSFNDWMKKGSDKKTKGERKRLQDILTAPTFRTEDLVGVNFDSIDKKLAEDVQSPWGGNGWTTSSVTVKVPTGTKQTKSVKKQKARAAQTARRHDDVDAHADRVAIHKFIVSDIHHRSLLHILKSAIEDGDAEDFHWHAFDEYWQPPTPGSPQERVYSELYTSKCFRDAERDLLSSPPEEGCDLPRVIIALMIWSDATHVAQFGQSKVWPIYIFFGNRSKYMRCKPSTRSAHHAAFLPSLPDTFEDFLRGLGIKKSDPLMAHCRRELFHEAWKLLLDDDFVTAYEHGIVLTCADGIRRRVYPRIFTYSADYPEKVLIATIRDMGGCPCPRCKIRKEVIRGVGTDADLKFRKENARQDNDEWRQKVDDARKLIYEDGYAVNSAKVEEILKDESLVPTENAFSRRLAEMVFQIFLILVVDLMHEFELGVWKALLSHLIRILNALGPSKLQEFNERFRQVPSFGRSTIRTFSHNVSEMKKLAARDFEDILQCCIPCFEGLLPSPHDETVADLLYLSTYWHALAKLHMHTDSSLAEFRLVTTGFTNALRHFTDVTCQAFDTVETDAEYAKRKRNEARRQQKAGTTSVGTSTERPDRGILPVGTSTRNEGSGKRKRQFNLSTSKAHAIADYPDQIEMFGTTDSYSTQIGELEHRTVKKRHGQTNKNKATKQLVNLDTVELVHDKMFAELQRTLSEDPKEALDEGEIDDRTQHYRIALEESPRARRDLLTWTQENKNDPAFKRHLLSRLRGGHRTGEEPDFSNDELNEVQFHRNCIYSHATATFNFTTYDVWRDQDTINVGKRGERRDVMVLSNEDTTDEDGNPVHPFWYARVLGIYHANVFYSAEPTFKPRRMEFLWVRWFGLDPEWAGGPSSLRLDRLGYVPENDSSGAFGFLNPSDILRACHLIPCFNLGRTKELLFPSKMRDSFVEGDWINYYINRFVDRDMMMRYLGLGVGHLNPPYFPRETGQLRADVLRENNEETWVTADTEDESESDEESDSDRSSDLDAVDELSDDELDEYEY
ncbi:hypothetical protein ARMSODRAFT_898121 [Armillaria solidipes]|uniref:Uncharacterized protein n=1 Tax=Armillaria solidipes TaxID=1076256 RepID=A0A2H3B019_9AGAR|nr:hypothetical protein ARMSODRAFT_898121 [Armillaria solidipes]